jgi:hypothetical protein
MYIQNMKALGSLLITAHANIWALKTLDTIHPGVLFYTIFNLHMEMLFNILYNYISILSS